MGVEDGQSLQRLGIPSTGVPPFSSMVMVMEALHLDPAIKEVSRRGIHMILHLQINCQLFKLLTRKILIGAERGGSFSPPSTGELPWTLVHMPTLARMRQG